MAARAVACGLLIVAACAPAADPLLLPSELDGKTTVIMAIGRRAQDGTFDELQFHVLRASDSGWRPERFGLDLDQSYGIELAGFGQSAAELGLQEGVALATELDPTPVPLAIDRADTLFLGQIDEGRLGGWTGEDWPTPLLSDLRVRGTEDPCATSGLSEIAFEPIALVGDSGVSATGDTLFLIGLGDGHVLAATQTSSTSPLIMYFVVGPDGVHEDRLLADRGLNFATAFGSAADGIWLAGEQGLLERYDYPNQTIERVVDPKPAYARIGKLTGSVDGREIYAVGRHYPDPTQAFAMSLVRSATSAHWQETLLGPATGDTVLRVALREPGVPIFSMEQPAAFELRAGALVPLVPPAPGGRVVGVAAVERGTVFATAPDGGATFTLLFPGDEPHWLALGSGSQAVTYAMAQMGSGFVFCSTGGWAGLGHRAGGQYFVCDRRIGVLASAKRTLVVEDDRHFWVAGGIGNHEAYSVYRGSLARSLAEEL